MDEEKTPREPTDESEEALELDEVKTDGYVDNRNLPGLQDLKSNGPENSAENGEEEERGEKNNRNIVNKNGANGIDSGQRDLDATHEQLEVPKGLPNDKENSRDSISENASSTEGSNEATSLTKSVSPRRAKRRAIFVSYAPEASFLEKRFISYTTKELKNIGFCDDIWFDKDDSQPIESPSCYQQRLEIVEKCRAAVIFLSESYFNSLICCHEGRILLNRDEEKEGNEEVEKPVKLFCINLSDKLPQEYKQLAERALNLSKYSASSVAELSSVVVGKFSEALEKYAPLFGLRIPTPPREPDVLKFDRKKPVSSWNIHDVQAWLASFKMQAHCALSFEENEIDGFLLVSIKETDMETHLNIDSRVARKKLLQEARKIQEEQDQLKGNWYLKCKKSKVKEDSVYVICDPSDARFYHNLRADLVQKNLKVFKHERLGQSREEFLQVNSPHLASSSHVIVLLSTAAATSLFVYNEVLFADWLGKPLLVAMTANSWDKLRPNLQAILGSCPAVNFQDNLYEDSVAILLYRLKPFRNMPAVILEQEFLDRMFEGLKPLRVMAAVPEMSNDEIEDTSPRPNLFLSYHWDVQNKVQVLVQFLESHGFQCWTDVSNANKRHAASKSPTHENSQSQIQRNIKAAVAVVCCVTPKYVCSENCIKDLSLAESMNKPVVPVMLQWLAWPPEGGRVRRILAPLQCIDMSNDSLFKRNLSTVESHLSKFAGSHNPRDTHVIEHVRIARNQRSNQKYQQKA